MTYLVSPCCGAEYTDNDDGPSECCGTKILLGLCKDCKEHAEPEEGYVCEDCKEFFEEPELDYEFHNKMIEAALEARADERRDMGE